MNARMSERKTHSRSHPKVSVIIPAKNEEQYLGRCLDAIAQIDYPASLTEVIVVDNNSTDGTAKLAVQHGAKVISSGAKTIGALRNEGAREAVGELLAFIDADIAVDRDWLANAVVHFGQGTVGAVGSSPDPDYENLTAVEDLWDRMVRPPLNGTRRVRYLPSGNLIVATEFFRRIGGFDEQLETCEDPEFGFRLSKVAEIIEDSSIRATHLRNPKNFWGFFKKEFWHGKGLTKGLLKYHDNPSALPSLLLPIAYLMVLISLVASVFTERRAFVLLAATTLALPLCYCVRSCSRSGNYSNFMRFYYLHFLYMSARSMAFAVGLFRELKPKRRTRQ